MHWQLKTSVIDFRLFIINQNYCSYRRNEAKYYELGHLIQSKIHFTFMIGNELYDPLDKERTWFVSTQTLSPTCSCNTIAVVPVCHCPWSTNRFLVIMIPFSTILNSVEVVEEIIDTVIIYRPLFSHIIFPVLVKVARLLNPMLNFTSLNLIILVTEVCWLRANKETASRNYIDVCCDRRNLHSRNLWKLLITSVVNG